MEALQLSVNETALPAEVTTMNWDRILPVTPFRTDWSRLAVKTTKPDSIREEPTTPNPESSEGGSITQEGEVILTSRDESIEIIPLSFEVPHEIW